MPLCAIPTRQHSRYMARALLAVLLATALLVAGAATAGLACRQPPSASQQATEFSGTVYVGGVGDLRLNPSTNQSKCSLLVDRAAEGGYGFSRLQFLISLSWWDSGPLDPPPGWPGCEHYTLSDYYCFSRFNSTLVEYWSYARLANGTAMPVTQGQIDQLQALLAACFAHAIAQGFDIAVNVHADDGRQMNGWRNTLAFDPLEKYGGFSYVDAFLIPIADALSSVMTASTRAWLALQGEMGATVFFYPWAWAEIAEAMRARIAAGRPGLARNIQLGLGINNSKLCGCVLIDIVDYDQYLAAFNKLWPSIEHWVDQDGLRQAFLAVDFVGISAYVPQTDLNFSACDMERLMEKMDVEFAYYNLTLRELNAAGVEIQWIEYGIGGGISQNGDQKATTAEEAMWWPYWGIYGDYRAELDPWTTFDQEDDNPVRDYMHHYYSQTSDYLMQGGCQYRVTGCYIWTVASWDVLGMYPQPEGTNGSYRDPGAVEIVGAHNGLVNGCRRGCQPPASQLAEADAAAGPHVALLP